MKRDSGSMPGPGGKTEREVFIMRQRRWDRLVKRGDWHGMAQHIRAIAEYDAAHGGPRKGRLMSAAARTTMRTINVDGVEYVSRDFCRELVTERDELSEALDLAVAAATSTNPDCGCDACKETRDAMRLWYIGEVRHG